MNQILSHELQHTSLAVDSAGDGLLNALTAADHQLRDIGRRDAFPLDAITLLRDIGLLAAPLPVPAGAGWGTEAEGMVPLGEALQVIGHASLGIGRIFEAHVNAIALIERFGALATRAEMRARVLDGALFAVWVAPSVQKLRLHHAGDRFHLLGDKGVCSGAGIATHAVVTCFDDNDLEQMVMIDTSMCRIGSSSSVVLHGMRHTATRAVSFDTMLGPQHLIGAGDDYVREPDLSAGAWRTSAITAGGLRALVDLAVRQLRERGRHTAPSQSARIGEMLIHARAATAWVRAAAVQAGTPGIAARALTSEVALARIAVEQACLATIPLVQRSLGLASLVTANPTETMMRDLATYLRQPAGDDVLHDAAVWFAEHPQEDAA